MTVDGRAGAWMGAWNILRHIEKLRMNHKKQPLESLPDLYWGYLAEAKILTLLATADTSVGLLAGEWIEREAADERSEVIGLQDMLDRFESKGDDE